MNKLTRYKQIEAFLFSQLPMFQRIGEKAMKKNLDNIKYLSKLDGHPHRVYKSIHIAGTNGKGSTAFFIATILHQHGYKVGLYTSPHYKDYRERIKVNGKKISKTFIKKYVNQIIERGVFGRRFVPSFFELSVSMAFEYFKFEQVDIAIVETGLGGITDSTNILNPEISVITNIALEHTKILGDTLAEIAANKAGIIKKETPVIIGRKQAETAPVFEKVAKRENADLMYVDQTSWPHKLRSLKNDFPSYQKENLNTAVATCLKFDNNLSFRKIEHALKNGLKEWGFIGRYMTVSRSPLTIFDSAHNPDGIRVLFKEIAKEKFVNLHIVIGVVNDKDLSKVLPLFPSNAKYYFAQAKIPRALDKEILKNKAALFELKGKTYSSVKRAYSSAQKSAQTSDLILVAGSIFTVAEVV